MVVLTKSCNGSYWLAELDGAVSKLRYAAFHLVPYQSQSHAFITVEDLLDPEDLLSLNSSSTDAEEDA